MKSAARGQRAPRLAKPGRPVQRPLGEAVRTGSCLCYRDGGGLSPVPPGAPSCPVRWKRGFREHSAHGHSPPCPAPHSLHGALVPVVSLVPDRARWGESSHPGRTAHPHGARCSHSRFSPKSLRRWRPTVARSPLQAPWLGPAAVPVCAPILGGRPPTSPRPAARPQRHRGRPEGVAVPTTVSTVGPVLSLAVSVLPSELARAEIGVSLFKWLKMRLREVKSFTQVAQSTGG